MSAPTTFDFAQIKIGDGATPEVFTLICGLETVGINEAAQVSERQVRDCTLPAKNPTRKLRVTGTTWDVSGTGLANVDQIATLKAALGKHYNYQIIPVDLSDPEIEAGTPLGTWAGEAVMTARNIGTVADGFATLEITLSGEGDLVWTPES